MKAEDIERLWNEAKKMPTKGQRIYALARACEQHGIERAKAHMTCPNCHGDGDEPGYNGRMTCTQCLGQPVDWSALDAEIAKENADET